ncbi:hypothetical protein HDA42_000297 [Streptomyces costaricanus]|uniref:Uncharacterized protein n=1 Tax=Streptomyces murinus TaxID=33900 RepID=A0A7W3RJF4_STRMR|nr:hypothetical protein [Streptomyces murinus]
MTTGYTRVIGAAVTDVGEQEAYGQRLLRRARRSALAESWSA